MTRPGDIKRYKQPTDIEPHRHGPHFTGSQLLVFGVVSVVALAVVALTAAVIAVSLAVVVVAIKPYLGNKK